MSRHADGILVGDRSPTLQATIAAVAVAFILVVTGSIVLKVEVVARGEGRVVPVMRVQVIQPEFAGQITAIEVSNAQTVQRGQTLVRLDPTAAHARLQRLQLESNRLQAEVVATRILVDSLVAALSEDALPSPVRATRAFTAAMDLPASLVHEQRAILVTELEMAAAQMTDRDARLEASLRAEEVAKAGLAALEAAQVLQQERLSSVRRLQEQGTASRAALLEAEGEVLELERRLAVEQRSVDEEAARRVVLRTGLATALAERRVALRRMMSVAEARLADIREEIDVAQREVDAATLTAPVSGVVDRLDIFTVGGVVAAGQELMTIVPSDTAMEVEVLFPNRDVGFLQNGQRANVRLDAYPSERFGYVRGTVDSVSADAVEIESELWGFRAEVELEAPVLVHAGTVHPLRPGMTAKVDVVTAERRVITYFFAPIVSAFQGALGER